MTRCRQAPRRRSGARQCGAALMEVLVSMLIVAMWLLANAGLQAGMFKLQKGAQFRTAAITLATELGERMEANSASARTGTYALKKGAAAESSKDCAGAACTPGELARYDLRQWQDRAGSVLVLEDVTIDWDAAAAVPTYRIRIAWKEPRGRQAYASAGTTETMSHSSVKVLR